MGNRTRTDPGYSAVSSTGELAAGDEVGRYIIGRCLGAGGMGVVYAAWDRELARHVALKTFQSRANPGAMQARLRREAKAMARLSHGNVVPVFDIGTHGQQLFLAMELIHGETLRAWALPRRPWRDIVSVFVRAGRGLAAAHTAGLLHRDFKPDNVLIDHDGEARITDFGLAREIDVDDSTEHAPFAFARDLRSSLSHVTATDALAGTLAYMAPERVLGLRSGAKADQFSYCVSLFEVLYGVHPFGTASLTPDAWVAAVRAHQLVPPGDRAVPGWLSAIVLRGMAFDPARRWPSMLALVDALERGLHRRRRWVSGALVAASALAVAIAAAVIAASRL